jgi:hypothetical protein
VQPAGGIFRHIGSCYLSVVFSLSPLAGRGLG